MAMAMASPPPPISSSTPQPRTPSPSPPLLLCFNPRLPTKPCCSLPPWKRLPFFPSASPPLLLPRLLRPPPPPAPSASAALPSSASSPSPASTQDAAEREEGMPVPNTVTFRRSATQKHYEYSTDLEALGMEAFSSGLSRAMAVSMGINPGPEESTTPVCISMDVSKEGRDLRLDGIVRTSLALHCSRCGIPVAERVFGEFSLLLTENPVVEPTKARIGVVLGDDSVMPDEQIELEDVLDLDLDDKLHFPRTQKSIDISKYIRDTVHLEIPLQCLCELSCEGKCINCGTNLNQGSCKCDLSAHEMNRQAIWGPLEELKKQLESEEDTS